MSDKAAISADRIKTRVEAGARIIDVRSDNGRASAGSIIGAGIVAKDAVAEFAASADKDEELVVFCGTTAGSGPVVDYLVAHGFTSVVHVDGGFEALKEVGLPVTPAAPAAG